MDFYVIRRPSAWRNQEELKAAKAKFAEVAEEMSGRLRWIRSYVVDEADGRLGSFSIYQAQDADSIRELTRRVGMPAAEFYRVNSNLIANEDSPEISSTSPTK